jgi:hypothetical protein
MEILEFYRKLQDEGYFTRMMLNPIAQFGTDAEPFLGASILPEVTKDENAYSEDQIRYRTLPALDGTRYSPTQLNGSGYLVGSFKVEFGDTDVASQLTAQDHDGLIKLLSRGSDVQAIAQAIQWADKTLLRPHLIKNEIQRWQAILDCQVIRRGSNGMEETVNYLNPAGHRVNAKTGSGTVASPTGWYGNNYDPFEQDIFPMAQFLSSKGYTVNRIICPRALAYVLARNPKVVQRTSRVTIAAGGQLSATMGQVTLEELSRIAMQDSLPPIEIYDRVYRTASGTVPFIPHNKFVMLCTTGRDQSIDIGDGQTIQLQDTLGYYGIGRPAGAAVPGRVVTTEIATRKPIGLFGEAYQTGLPVITEPEAIAVITVDPPTP